MLAKSREGWLDIFQNCLVGEGVFDTWKWAVKFLKIWNHGPPYYLVTKSTIHIFCRYILPQIFAQWEASFKAALKTAEEHC